MRLSHRVASLSALVAALAPAALIACGDDTNGSGTDATTTTATETTTGDTGSDVAPAGSHAGTAAIGAPIVGAAVAVKCDDASTYTGTTGADGSFVLDVPADSLPCALQLTGGTANGAANTTTLHSLASDVGVVNITPLTDLALARVVNDVTDLALATWFASPSELTAIEAALVDGTDALRAALASAGYTIPASWSAGGTAPFTTPFTANPTTDPYDALLESVADALADAGTSYADLLASFVDGGALPDAPIGPAPKDPPPTGDGAALAGADGATGTLGSTTHTFTTNVQWAVFPTQTTGLFSAYGPAAGGFDPITSWLVSSVPATVGTHYCKADGLLPRIQLVLGGVNHDTAPAGGSCTIEITSVTQGAVEGRFSATLIDMNGAVAGTVVDGYFRKAASTGGGEVLPAGEVGVSFDVDGVTHRYANAFSLAYENFAGMTATPAELSSPGSPIGIQIHSVPSQLGTFACDSHQGNEYRKLNVWFYWNGIYHHAGNRASPDAGPAGSSCSITVTKAGSFANGEYVGTFEGTFEGTFKSWDLASTVNVTNGKFRYIGADFVVSPVVAALAGTYTPEVVSGSPQLGLATGSTATVVVGADGTVTIGDHTFLAGAYSSHDNSNAHFEPNVSFTLPAPIGETTSPKLTIYLDAPGSTTPQAFHIEADAEGFRREASLGFRPIPEARADFIADLLAGSPYTLVTTSSDWGADFECVEHVITVTGSADPASPYFEFSGPGAYERYSDTALLTEVDGARTMLNYYSKLTIAADGTLHLRDLGGNKQDTNTFHTNDAAMIEAACP